MDRVDAFHRTHRVTDLRVIDFYEANPAIDFDRVNRFVVDMLDGLNVQGETEFAKEVRQLRESLHDAQRSYGETLRQLVAGASSENGERVAAALVRPTWCEFIQKLKVVQAPETVHGDQQDGV